MRHDTRAVSGHLNGRASTGSVHVEGAFLFGGTAISAITESLTGQALSLIYTPTLADDLGESGLGDDNPYTNPLADALARYADFFDLFTDFAGYTQHFLLEDLADPVTGAIDFRLPFHGFDDHNHTAFPRSRDEYFAYSAKAVAFVEARNRRIAAWAAEHLST